MDPFLSLVLLGSILGSGTWQVSEAAENVSMTTQNSLSNVTEAKPTHHHPLPPAAMPGILNDFEPSLKFRRQRRFLTELRFLKNGMSPADKPLTRKRRSLASPKLLPRAIKLLGSRKKRDLRRLRRDLSYSLTPREGFPQQPQQRPFQRPLKNPARGEELSRLLRGLNFFDELALQTQQQKFSPMVVPEKTEQMYASRFAPQPKVFRDENLDRRPSLRVRPYPDWETYENGEGHLRLPEKRWPKPGAWGGLAMVPGLKRSVFREAARQQELRKAHGIVKRGRRESDPSMDAFLGTPILNQSANRIRRTAM